MYKKFIFAFVIFIIVLLTIIYINPILHKIMYNYKSSSQNILVGKHSKRFTEQKRVKYKEKIEQIINEDVPKSKELISNVSLEIKNENDINIRQTIIDYGVTDVLFKFYSKLIDVTEEFVSIKPKVPATDWYIELQELITPYLTDNDVDMTQIKSLLEYAENAQNEINKIYINH